MNVSFRRILKTDNVEGWNIYSEEEASDDIDVVIVVFGEKMNLLYVFSNSMDRLNNVDYLTSICNLVHDLPTDFYLNKKLMENAISDISIDEYVSKCITPSTGMQLSMDEY